MRGKPGRTDADTAALEADAAFFGLTLPQEIPPEPDELWEEHLPAMTAFLAVAGQWRTASVGLAGLLWLGLDYSAARHGLELAGIEVTPAIWGQVKKIEAGAREELNRRD